MVACTGGYREGVAEREGAEPARCTAWDGSDLHTALGEVEGRECAQIEAWCGCGNGQEGVRESWGQLCRHAGSHSKAGA